MHKKIIITMLMTACQIHASDPLKAIHENVLLALEDSQINLTEYPELIERLSSLEKIIFLYRAEIPKSFITHTEEHGKPELCTLSQVCKTVMNEYRSLKTPILQ